MEIREGLAKENPAVFEPKLAGSLALLADYWVQRGKVTEARENVQRATQLILPYAIEGTTYADWLIAMKQDLVKYQALE